MRRCHGYGYLEEAVYMKALMKVRGLSVGFDGNILVSNLEFDIESGDLIALVGRNGAGKTTLSKVLLGLIEPLSGTMEIHIDEQWVHATPENLRHLVYYTFQNPDNQIVGTIVEDDVAFGAENSCIERLKMLDRVKSSIKQVGLEGYEKINPYFLSGGQKQRLAVAGALCVGSKLIIMDEPTAMLDPEGRKDVWSLIKELRSHGVAILLITHDPNEIKECESYLCLLGQGEWIYSKEYKELYKDENFSRLSLREHESVFIDRIGVKRVG
jgi:energy-coupling factor transport system ATP-binding protein